MITLYILDLEDEIDTAFLRELEVNIISMYQPSSTIIYIPKGVCNMKEATINTTNEALYTNKVRCLQNLWLALKDRYTKENMTKESDTNDSYLRKTKY